MVNKKFYYLLKTMIKNELRGQFMKMGNRSLYTQIFIYFSYLLWGFFISLAHFLKPISSYPISIYSLFAFQFMLIFFIFVLELNRTLLYPEDAMVLLKLPIKKENILMSKFYSTIFFAFFYAILLSITWNFWGFRLGFSQGVIHFLILTFFTVLNAMFIVLIGITLYLLIYSVIGSKYIKRFFVFFTLLATILLYYFIFSTNSKMQIVGEPHIKYIPAYYFYLIYKFFLNNQQEKVFLYIGLMFVVGVIFLYLVSKFFSVFYLHFLRNITQQEGITVRYKRISKNPMKILLFNYLKRDNEFLLKTFNSFIFYIIFIIFIFMKEKSNINSLSGSSAIMGMIIYITLYVIFLSMINIQYSKEYEAAFIYKIIPKRRGTLVLQAIDIIFHYFMLLPIIISGIIIGIKLDWYKAVFFLILTYLLGNNLLYLFNIISPILPLSKKYDTKKSGGVVLLYFLILFPYIGIGILAYYFYYENNFIYVIILLFMLILDMLFREILKKHY